MPARCATSSHPVESEASSAYDYRANLPLLVFDTKGTRQPSVVARQLSAPALSFSIGDRNVTPVPYRMARPYWVSDAAYPDFIGLALEIIDVTLEQLVTAVVRVIRVELSTGERNSRPAAQIRQGRI